MSETQDTSVTTNPKPACSAKGKAAVGLLFLLVLGVGGFSAYQYHQQQLSAQTSTQQIAELTHELAALKNQPSTTDALKQALNEQLAQVTAQQLQLTQRQQELEKQWQEKQQQQPNDWLLNEASYLIRMAGRKLWLEQDINTATALLSDADTRLLAMADPSLIPLRKALAEDIATLKASPVVDMEGLSLEVGTLVDNVDQLKIKGLNPAYQTDPLDEDVSSDVTDWKENLKKSMANFASNFITVRRQDGDVEALLSPEQSAYLQENMRLQLQLAQTSLLKQDQTNFRDHLAKAADWLNSYYDENDSATQFMQKSLKKLQETEVQSHYPTTFKAQPLLEQLMATHRLPTLK